MAPKKGGKEASHSTPTPFHNVRCLNHILEVTNDFDTPFNALLFPLATARPVESSMVTSTAAKAAPADRRASGGGPPSRSKATARKSTGGKAPKKTLPSTNRQLQSLRRLYSVMTYLTTLFDPTRQRRSRPRRASTEETTLSTGDCGA